MIEVHIAAPSPRQGITTLNSPVERYIMGKRYLVSKIRYARDKRHRTGWQAWVEFDDPAIALPAWNPTSPEDVVRLHWESGTAIAGDLRLAITDAAEVGTPLNASPDETGHCSRCGRQWPTYGPEQLPFP